MRQTRLGKALDFMLANNFIDFSLQRLWHWTHSAGILAIDNCGRYTIRNSTLYPEGIEHHKWSLLRGLLYKWMSDTLAYKFSVCGCMTSRSNNTCVTILVSTASFQTRSTGDSGDCLRTAYLCIYYINLPSSMYRRSKTCHQFSFITFAFSRMNLPSLYFWDSSKAFSYFQPSTSWHWKQWMSATVCIPVMRWRSSLGPTDTFTTFATR